MDTLHRVGWFPSIAIGRDGFAVISHRDETNQDLRVTHCSNVTCTQATTVQADTVGNVGRDSSILIGSDGFPFIAYSDGTNRRLKVMHCADAACTARTIRTVPSSTNADGSFPRLALADDGLPIVATIASDDAVDRIRVARCADVACSTLTAIDIVSNADAGWLGGLHIVGGAPVAVWARNSDGLALVTRCADAACSSATTQTLVPATQVATVLGNDGLLAMAFGQGSIVGFLRCRDSACAAYDSAKVEGGLWPSIAMAAHGLPVLAYQSNGLRVTRCQSRTCQ